MAKGAPKAKRAANAKAPAKAPTAPPPADDGLVAAHLKHPQPGQLSIPSSNPLQPHVFIDSKARVTPEAHAELLAAGLIEERTDDDPPPDVTVTAIDAPPEATPDAGAAPTGLQTVYGRLPDYADDSPEAVVDFWYRETHVRWRHLSIDEQRAKAKLVEYIRQFTDGAVAQALTTKKKS